MSITKDSIKTLTLSENDLQKGIKVINSYHPVQRWVKSGKLAADIEMEISNVQNFARNRPEYRKLVSSHDIDDREIIRQLMQRMAR